MRLRVGVIGARRARGGTGPYVAYALARAGCEVCAVVGTSPESLAEARQLLEVRAAGIPTYGIMGLFMKDDDIFAHGLNERVPVRAFFDGLEYWKTVLTRLSGRRAS